MGQWREQANLLLDFNPRPHEEGDKNAVGKDSWMEDFNPRPHEEGDSAVFSHATIVIISIHALTRRATSEIRKHMPELTDFNPRPHEEGDQN